MKPRELLMFVLAVLSVVCGSVSFMVPKLISVALAVVGLVCGIVALWLHVSRPK